MRRPSYDVTLSRNSRKGSPCGLPRDRPITSTSFEDADASRTDEQSDDDQDDPPQDRATDDRHDACDDEHHRDDPEEQRQAAIHRDQSKNHGVLPIVWADRPSPDGPTAKQGN